MTFETLEVSPNSLIRGERHRPGLTRAINNYSLCKHHP